MADEKLTDVGSSRNINIHVRKTMFTRGIWTPMYMVPEVLDKEKYKKAADVAWSSSTRPRRHCKHMSS